MKNRRNTAVKPPRVPSYCHHKASGQAYLKVKGRTLYLGLYGSQDSRDAYADAVAAVLAGNEPQASVPSRNVSAPQGSLPVADVCDRYLAYAKGYYRKNGKVTSEVAMISSACAHAKALFGDCPAESFGPLALKAVRSRMIAAGLARTTVNKGVHRIRRAFKWAAGEELIPASVAASLSMVSGLRAGRTEARESEPVQPIDDSVVDATLPHLPAVVADMVRLQRLAGMRPAEVCLIRPCDVDRSGEVWVYTPESHKTEHHGRQRVIFIGPQGQKVLLPYLDRDPQIRCFRPCDSEAKRRAQQHSIRTTPLCCGNTPGSNVKPLPLRKAGVEYTSSTYGKAVTRACKNAGVERWSPNRLRHTAATEVRAKFGLEAAQTILGHSTARMSEHYAEKNLAAGAEVARAIG